MIIVKGVTIVGSVLLAFLMSCNDTLNDGPESELMGVVWELQSLEMEDGEVLTPFPDEIHTIEFKEDHSLAGLKDCNECKGTYETGANGSISITSFVCTEMGCGRTFLPSRASRMYHEAVAAVTSYEVSDTHLRLYFDDKNSVSGVMNFRAE